MPANRSRQGIRQFTQAADLGIHPTVHRKLGESSFSCDKDLEIKDLAVKKAPSPSIRGTQGERILLVRRQVTKLGRGRQTLGGRHGGQEHFSELLFRRLGHFKKTIARAGGRN